MYAHPAESTPFRIVYFSIFLKFKKWSYGRFMNIGIAIKRLRMRKGLSQYELAQLCGFRQSLLSNYETGLNKPNAASLKKITDFFQVPEILIYMLAVEISDIPADKRDEFERVFPEMVRVMLALFD